MIYNKQISGETFVDERGQLNFFNAFDMASIRRIYEIKHKNVNIIRAWQAHKNEMKWFYCHTGSFLMQLIEVDDFEQPSNHLEPKRIILEANKPSILELSGGYATGFKALEENSTLQVFSNFNLNESKNDDYRYPIEKWHAEW